MLTAIGEGLLSPDEAKIVLACINTHAQIKQGDDHEARLAALECQFVTRLWDTDCRGKVNAESRCRTSFATLNPVWAMREW
ncbi:MAG: hypothetical protein KGI35_03470 [Burkholderiales bacterium]|nr:hypothetical protein [Burkholderiales bacterium]MDE2396452.1 hypothetical protein [Burkholderiales bacterium]